MRQPAKLSAGQIYQGVLAEPMMPLFPKPLKPLSPPIGSAAPQLMLLIDAINSLFWRKNREARTVGHEQFTERFFALLGHYDCDFCRDPICRDLAISLTLAHEPEYLQGPNCRYSQIFSKYGLNPADPSADFALALKLARKYVPGFRSLSAPEHSSRHTVVELTHFIHAAMGVQRWHQDRGKPATDRAIARTICDPKTLTSILGERHACAIAAWRGRVGNKPRTNTGILSERAIRKLLSEFRSAPAAYVQGNPTGFQTQIVEDLLPILFDETDLPDFS